MPLIIPNKLPAADSLKNENIFTMERARAISQDIRPLKILIVNLMPTKVATETQLARVLANTPLQVELTLLRMDSHESQNTAEEHLDAFYMTLPEVINERFDGMILTGAPVETIPFEEVDYWDELCKILEYSKNTARCIFAGGRRRGFFIITA
jgi:homoserine O-succinyltransferase